jgi:threonine dehydrogenase-like Zn-dependent dehydrogenase
MSYTEMKNPAYYLHGPEKAEIRDSPIPEIHDPHDVIVRIGFVGVCGSDVRSCSSHQAIFSFFDEDEPYLQFPRPIN